MAIRSLGGALLIAALPLFCQTAPHTKSSEVLRFTLNETPGQIVKLMGRPERVDDSLPAYQSWQYEYPADEENDDNSPKAWFLCVGNGTRQLLSVTRNFARPQNVDDLFPESSTVVHHWPAKGPAQFSVRLRRLSDENLLLAMGTEKPGETTTQLVLIRRSALKLLIPWLAEQVR